MTRRRDIMILIRNQWRAFCRDKISSLCDIRASANITEFLVCRMITHTPPTFFLCSYRIALARSVSIWNLHNDTNQTKLFRKFKICHFFFSNRYIYRNIKVRAILKLKIEIFQIGNYRTKIGILHHCAGLDPEPTK